MRPSLTRLLVGLSEKEARIAKEKELGIYKEQKVGPSAAGEESGPPVPGDVEGLCAPRGAPFGFEGSPRQAVWTRDVG